MTANSELADGVGFEPTRSLHPCRFSRPVPSTTRPPIHVIDVIVFLSKTKWVQMALATEIATELAHFRSTSPFIAPRNAASEGRQHPPASWPLCGCKGRGSWPRSNARAGSRPTMGCTPARERCVDGCAEDHETEPAGDLIPAEPDNPESPP